MNHIYVVRHGKAEGQAPDAPLTAEGAQQAIRLAEWFADKPIDDIVSSPYERAYRSIQPLADRLGIEVVLDDRLTERVLSSRSDPDWRERLLKTYDDLDLCYEGGESSRSAMNRAVQAVKEVLARGCRNAVIVSHGNLISLLLKHFDDRIGFNEWASMTNPDVYRLSFQTRNPGIQRVWTE